LKADMRKLLDNVRTTAAQANNANSTFRDRLFR
jgi:hypothetical protein